MATRSSSSVGGNSGARWEILDALRGVAAFAVCCFHFKGEILAQLPLVGFFFSQGYLGVYSFFVISGFVIPWSLHGKIESVVDFFRFLLRRFLRLYPAYFVAVIFTVVLWYTTSMVPGFQGQAPAIDGIEYLTNLTLTAELSFQPWILVVAWTLAIEAQFYVLVGLSMPLLSHRRFSVRVITLLGWIVGSLLVPNHAWITAYGPIFALGIAWYMRRKDLLDRKTLGGFIGLIALVQTREVWLSPESVENVVLSTSVMSAVAGGTTLLAIAKFADSKCSLFWIRTGAISYSLYLLHVPVGGRIINLAQRLGDAWWIEALAMVLALGVSIITAKLFFVLVEAPSHRWAREVRVSSSRNAKTIQC